MRFHKFISFIIIVCLTTLFAGICWADGTYTSTTSNTHALSLTSGSETYSDITVTKTGGPSDQNDDYDWEGTNAAVYAGSGAVLTITGSSTTINSDAAYGNAVFAYGGGSGDGTKIVISDAKITTFSKNSGGIMVTGGGIISADNLTITTSGGSSAAIRSDKGGGTINVNGGTYTTSGVGSPAIYSTADITVSNANLVSTTAQGVVIEGKNSVTLNNCSMEVDNTTVNGDKTTYKQAVMLYQSMSGDSDEGTSEFTMTGGEITNEQGDIFFVTNNTVKINLSGVTITNNDDSGIFLRAEEAGWGTSGSNGGSVTLVATDQNIMGDIVTDSSSSLTMTLSGDSTFTGTINSDNAGTVNIIVGSGATLTLTGDSYVNALTNNGGTIDYASYTLEVNGTEYNSGATYNNEAEVDETDTDSTGSTGNTGGTTGETGGESGGTTGERSGTTGESGSTTTTTSNDDDDSGCNAGYSLLSLMALSLALRFRVKK